MNYHASVAAMRLCMGMKNEYLVAPPNVPHAREKILCMASQVKVMHPYTRWVSV